MSESVQLVGIVRDLGGRSILRDVFLTIPNGQTCAIIGPSGAGKSTLLNLIGLLDRPCQGRLLLGGEDVTDASAAQRAVLRNRHLGFVFQSFNLLPRLCALDNVALPLSYRGVPASVAKAAAAQQMRSVGLQGYEAQRPATLSGGQRQRVAIARALVTEPRLLLADEPTGNLDGDTAADILHLLLTLNRERGVTLLMVTHDAQIARALDRRIEVSGGRVADVA
ncbi:ABC transporter ATP-binding protein [Pseudomonas parafulva]|uniref:ABC transporter ATP-binding protein n=1 Tax=Pseudomonas parafulva TaxID=157782 RepID=UPI001F076BA4|nr:ABC transporter ATP-binding protein [Pseudomonas parafulva]